MPAFFEPLLKGNVLREDFVTETQTNNVLSSVFLGIGMMLFGLIVFSLFFWAYSLDKSIFIITFSVLVLLYSILMTALVVLKRSTMSPALFRFYLGTAIFMDCVTIITITFFSIKWFKNPVGKLGLELPVEDYLRGRNRG